MRKTDSERQIRGLGRDTAARLSVMKENKLSLIGVERVERDTFSCSRSNPQLWFEKFCPDQRPVFSPRAPSLALLLYRDLNGLMWKSASFDICTRGTEIMWGLKGAVPMVMMMKAISASAPEQLK